jgi:hypothetical protein
MALLYSERSKSDQADELIDKSVEISEKRHFKKGIAYAMLHRAQDLMLKGMNDNALKEIENVKTTFETLNDQLGLAYCNTLEGLILKRDKKNKKAIIKFDEAVHFLRGYLMPYYKSKLYTELSLLYKLTGNAEKAAKAKENAMEKQAQSEQSQSKS